MLKMLKMALIPASVALTSCGYANTPSDTPPVTTETGRELPGAVAVAAPHNHGLYKVCDNGRLIYVSYSFQKPGGIAVVSDAQECRK